MKFSRHFQIGRSQSELDFVDVELARDMPLFLDSYALRTRADSWSVSCTRQIAEFFQALLDAVRHDSDAEARRLLSALHEPNETRLGLSRGRPQGNAIGTGLAADMLASLKKSDAVRTGMLNDLSESELFVEGIGADRISDLTTNILRSKLIAYTQEQCRLHRIEMSPDVASGPMWNPDRLEWEEEFVRLPIIGQSKILLVPKSLVRWKPSLTHREYYDKFVIDFLQMHELEKPGSRFITVLKGSKARRVYKKDLKEEYPLSKHFLLTFSREHPDVLERYRTAKAAPPPISDIELDAAFDEPLFARQLINSLRDIPLGSEGAAIFHRFMIGALEFLLYPNLIYPRKEREIDEGRKRIDIAYTNHAESGVFRRFAAATGLTATEILVECKNYQEDVGNPELDQLTGRFAVHRGWLGVLVCRRLANKALFRQRCRDAARAGRGYVIAVDDEDIILMLEAIERHDRNALMAHVDSVFRDLLA